MVEGPLSLVTGAYQCRAENEYGISSSMELLVAGESTLSQLHTYMYHAHVILASLSLQSFAYHSDVHLKLTRVCSTPYVLCNFLLRIVLATTVHSVFPHPMQASR